MPGTKPQKKKRFQHFLLTQFNLKNFPQGEHANEEAWIEWTRNRITLFRKYCLPSILNQSDQDFTWILYFDQDTPDEFRPFIEELQAISNIQIVFFQGMDEFDIRYMDPIKALSSPDSPWILTSRMDNDDALHRDAIRMIRSNFRAKQGFLISLSSGYVLDPQEMTLSHYYYPMSPFISLVERNNGRFRGIFQRGHTRWNELRLGVIKELWHEYFNPAGRKAYFVVDKPLWIQIVHGENISNSFYRGLPVASEVELEEFGLIGRSQRNSLYHLPKYYHYVMWKRYLKSAIVKYMKKPRHG